MTDEITMFIYFHYQVALLELERERGRLDELWASRKVRLDLALKLRLFERDVLDVSLWCSGFFMNFDLFFWENRNLWRFRNFVLNFKFKKTSNFVLQNLICIKNVFMYSTPPPTPLPHAVITSVRDVGEGGREIGDGSGRGAGRKESSTTLRNRPSPPKQCLWGGWGCLREVVWGLRVLKGYTFLWGGWGCFERMKGVWLIWMHFCPYIVRFIFFTASFLTPFKAVLWRFRVLNIKGYFI